MKSFLELYEEKEATHKPVVGGFIRPKAITTGLCVDSFSSYSSKNDFINLYVLMFWQNVLDGHHYLN